MDMRQNTVSFLPHYKDMGGGGEEMNPRFPLNRIQALVPSLLRMWRLREIQHFTVESNLSSPAQSFYWLKCPAQSFSMWDKMRKMKKIDCLYHHHHWRNSSFLTIAFLRRYCRIRYGFHFFRFRNSNFSIEQCRQPCVQPPTWRIRSLYLCPPVSGWPSYTPGTGFPFRRFLRLARLRWRYSNSPPHLKDN
jgi:hypothetical protein